MANEKFFRDIDQLQVDMEEEVSRLVRTLALEIFSTVTLITPVGNPTLWQNPNSKPAGYVGGRARGNWQISENVPVATETGNIDPDGRATIKDGERKIQTIRLGNDIVIQNNVPYIVALNEGKPEGTKHSEQAPIGFVENSVAVAQRAFNSEGFRL
jgi:hypothetical protein